MVIPKIAANPVDWKENKQIGYFFFFFLVGYVEERPLWPIQSPNKSCRTQESKKKARRSINCMFLDE